MAYVNPSTQNLKTCFQTHYSLPYFQREYRWESRHFQELLNDIQGAFIENYDPSHGRNQVANYSPYFLGSIITAAEQEGKRPLIDGQQRLTSTFLMLAYLHRYRKDHDVAAALDLSTLLGSVSFGVQDYSIEFSPTRKAIFDRYLNFGKSSEEAIVDAEDVPDLNDGDKRLLEALRNTDSLLDSTVKTAMAYFVDYVVERVLLIDIAVNTESEAHRVFVTMNDRGLRLGPIDLLKGQILSKLPVPADSQACHAVWVKMINDLRALGSEEDSLFFRNLFRAKWAETIRGKTKGEPRDFDTIGDAYHRWFEHNTARMGIVNADDYARFARNDLPRYAEMYAFIKKAESDLVPGHEALYFNGARKFSSQAMILLSVANVNDTTDQWKAKLNLAAKFLDLLLTTRTIGGKENNYDSLREISFQISKDIRGKSYEELLSYVRTEWVKHEVVLPDLAKLSYVRTSGPDILFLLARIATHLEEAFELTNKVGFVAYWQRDRNKKTFDIEHLLKSAFDPAALPASHGFADAKDYSEARNFMGALALLSRSRNRSLQDQAYRDKLVSYATESILTQTLCPNLYSSNPNVAAYVAANPSFKLSAIGDFGKNHISQRGELYVAVAKRVWQSP